MRGTRLRRPPPDHVTISGADQGVPYRNSGLVAQVFQPVFGNTPPEHRRPHRPPRAVATGNSAPSGRRASGTRAAAPYAEWHQHRTRAACPMLRVRRPRVDPRGAFGLPAPLRSLPPPAPQRPRPPVPFARAGASSVPPLWRARRRPALRPRSACFDPRGRALRPRRDLARPCASASTTATSRPNARERAAYTTPIPSLTMSYPATTGVPSVLTVSA